MSNLETLYNALRTAEQPSVHVREMLADGALNEVIPELAALVGVAQGCDYHPEGDVFEHSMLSLDYAVNRLKIVGFSERDQMITVFSALLHDIGKAETTRIENGRISARNHDKVGAPIAHDIMLRLGADENMANAVAVLVETHMRGMNTEFTPRAALRLTRTLINSGATIEQWREVALADKNGRGEGAKDGHGEPYSIFLKLRAAIAQDD